MAVRVARGAKKRVAEEGNSMFLQVRHPSDEGLAKAVLDGMPKEVPGIRIEIEAVWTPLGPYVWYEHGEWSERRQGEFVDLLARRLEESGLTDGVVDALERWGPLYGLTHVPRAVVLRLYPPPPPAYPRPPYQRPLPSRWYAELPEGWIDEAYRWVRGDQGDHDRLWALVQLMTFTVPVAEGRSFLQRCRTKQTHFQLVTGNQEMMEPPEGRWHPKGMNRSQIEAKDIAAIGGHVRACTGSAHDFEPTFALAGGGPATTDDELLAIFATFVDLARRLAPELAYAIIEIEPTFRRFTQPVHNTYWNRFHLLCDEYAFDAFPYQILGPGHLHRLGGTPEGARPLDGDRVELAFGEPEEWLNDGGWDDDPAERRRGGEAMWLAGRQVLEPCLLTGRSVWPLLSAREVPVRQGGDKDGP